MTRLQELARPLVAMTRDRSEADDDRAVGRFAVLGAAAAAILFLLEVTLAPDRERNAILVLTGVGGTVLIVIGFLSRTRVGRLRVAAGLTLMILGVGAGALLTDGLGAAAVLPLAGVLLLLPVRSARALKAVFVGGFAVSLVGEAAGYFVGGLASHGDLNAPLAAVESGFMLAFVYGVVWWVAERWRRADEEARGILATQRRLMEVNEQLVSTLDPRSVLELIAESLKTVVRYDNLTIYRVDADANILRPVISRDRFADLIMATDIALDWGITGWVVRHGEAACLNDAHLDPRTGQIPGTPAEPESMIVVPLRAGGLVVGTLNLGRIGGREVHYTPAEFELARVFASQASIALRNAETHRAVLTRAATDSLTGLGNRGAFDQRLRHLLADPGATPVALIMLDLDGFKSYNDHWGHPAGDLVLRAVGGAIHSVLRDGESFRYGGDEFAVLLANATERAATVVGERLAAAVAAIDEGRGHSVTVTVGTGFYPADGTREEELVAAADAALYRAKQLRMSTAPMASASALA